MDVLQVALEDVEDVPARAPDVKVDALGDAQRVVLIVPVDVKDVQHVEMHVLHLALQVAKLDATQHV